MTKRKLFTCNVEGLAGGVSHALNFHDCFRFPGGGDGSIRNWPGGLISQIGIDIGRVVINTIPHVNHVKVVKGGQNVIRQDVKHGRNRAGVGNGLRENDEGQDAATVFVNRPCESFAVI